MYMYMCKLFPVVGPCQLQTNTLLHLGTVFIPVFTDHMLCKTKFHGRKGGLNCILLDEWAVNNIPHYTCCFVTCVYCSHVHGNEKNYSEWLTISNLILLQGCSAGWYRECTHQFVLWVCYIQCVGLHGSHQGHSRRRCHKQR